MGRNLLKGGMRRAWFFPSASTQCDKCTKSKVSANNWTILINSWIHSIYERKTGGRKQPLCCGAPTLIHNDNNIFLDWLWALFALVGLFGSPGNLRAIDNQSSCSRQGSQWCFGTKWTLHNTLTQYRNLTRLMTHHHNYSPVEIVL